MVDDSGRVDGEKQDEGEAMKRWTVGALVCPRTSMQALEGPNQRFLTNVMPIR